MKWFLTLLLAGPLCAAGGPTIFFSKSFPGSNPAYFHVMLDRSGSAQYGEAPDDDNPLKFQLSESESAQVFGLVDKLDRLKKPVASEAKVAFMGAKVMRYEDDSGKTETKFNFTVDEDAKALVDWFERMGESARCRIELERAAKYDKLGVFKAVSLLNSAWNRKRVVGAEQFLPVLDRIAKNGTYMHTARVRASELAEAIRRTRQSPSQ